MRTEELTLPGFRHDVCSAIHPLGRAAFDRGVEWLESPAALAHPFDDEEAVLLYRSCRRDRGDARRATRMRTAGWFAPAGSGLEPWQLVRAFGARGALRAVSTAERVAHRALLRPIADARFSPATPRTRCSRSRTRPSAGFALVLLTLGHVVGWPFPRGGSQAIADALAARLRELGGEIVTSSLVDELPRADVVLCDVVPARARAALRGSRTYARPATATGRARSSSTGRSPARSRGATSAARQAATVHLGGTYDEIAASERAPEGLSPTRSCCSPSRRSGTRRARRPGSTRPGRTATSRTRPTVDMTDAIEAQVERFAPGFRERILARSARGPHELEAYNRNLVGGDLNGGLDGPAPALHRPVAQRDSVPDAAAQGVYLCSAVDAARRRRARHVRLRRGEGGAPRSGRATVRRRATYVRWRCGATTCRRPRSRARDPAERVQRRRSTTAGSGAPLMYQFEPLSATIIPYVFSAWSTIARLLREAARCRRSPSGARAGPSAAATGRRTTTRSAARDRRTRGACATTVKRSAWSIAPRATSS